MLLPVMAFVFALVMVYEYTSQQTQEGHVDQVGS